MPINTLAYISNEEWIKTKKAEVIKFTPNKPQMKLYHAIAECYRRGIPPRVIILKARQMGFSTMSGGIIFKCCATEANVKANITAHKEDSTTAIFNMYKLFYNHLRDELRPSKMASNAKELYFNTRDGKGLNSSIRCYTAGSDAIGRGETFQYLHISEYAFWGNNKKDILLGLLQTVPKELDTLVIIESTARGFDDFRTRWMQAVSGESGYIPVFVGWNEMDEYRSTYDGVPLTTEEQQLVKDYGLDVEQIQWRRDTLRGECGGDINQFHQEYPITPDEAFIATGETYFDTNAVISQLKTAERLTAEEGEFDYITDTNGKVINDSIRWVAYKGGMIKIYKQPEEGVPYVVGGDTAGEGSDRSTGHVLDNRTGEQVARLCGNMDEDKYVYQMYCLGYHYNKALVGIENNFNTYQNKVLAERLEYPNVFMQQREDVLTHQVRPIYGFRTDKVTRPQILSTLRVIVRDYANLLNDTDTLREMLTFIISEQGKPEAMSGEHDDNIMGLAIAHYLRPNQAYKKLEEEPPRKKKFIEMKGLRAL